MGSQTNFTFLIFKEKRMEVKDYISYWFIQPLKTIDKISIEESIREKITFPTNSDENRWAKNCGHLLKQSTAVMSNAFPSSYSQKTAMPAVILSSYYGKQFSIISLFICSSRKPNQIFRKNWFHFRRLLIHNCFCLAYRTQFLIQCFHWKKSHNQTDVKSNPIANWSLETSWLWR